MPQWTVTVYLESAYESWFVEVWAQRGDFSLSRLAAFVHRNARAIGALWPREIDTTRRRMTQPCRRLHTCLRRAASKLSIGDLRIKDDVRALIENIRTGV
jgi:hypothetical protein